MFAPIVRDRKVVLFDEKPLFADDYRAESNVLKTQSVLTIMMQGPIKYENNFTYETLKLYKTIFPNCLLVLSTWKTEKADTIEKFRALGVKVLLNDAPEIKGLYNINYQILSTQQGLKYAKDLGAEYVIKTRTDQRFYETNIPEFLFNLLKVFPVYDAKVQKSRLVTLSFNTFKYRLYDVSDMFLFGHIDDVIKFWACDFEKRAEFPQTTNMLEYSQARPSEIYYTTEYLAKLGHKCEWTVKDSWCCYANYFCVIDASSIGFYWPKYSHLLNRWRNFFGTNPELEELTFKEWLNLYAGVDNIVTDKAEANLHNGWVWNNVLSNREKWFKGNIFSCRGGTLRKIVEFFYKKKIKNNKLKITIFRIPIYSKKL